MKLEIQYAIVVCHGVRACPPELGGGGGGGAVPMLPLPMGTGVYCYPARVCSRGNVIMLGTGT